MVASFSTHRSMDSGEAEPHLECSARFFASKRIRCPMLDGRVGWCSTSRKRRSGNQSERAKMLGLSEYVCSVDQSFNSNM